MAARTAHVDFETRSRCDLKKRGVEVYAADPSTEAICLAWKFDGGPTECINLLDPNADDTGLAELHEHVAAGGHVIAHNARFELHIWAMLSRRWSWPELKADQVTDTMALARAMTLPGSLEQLAQALRLPIEKDKAGHRLMLQMCKPRKPRKHEPADLVAWNEDPYQIARLMEYCVRDVDVEEAVHAKLLPLIPSERTLWLLDQKINSRGVRVDLENVGRLLAATDAEQERLKSEIRTLTGRVVTSPGATKKLIEWLAGQGVTLPDVRKDTVARALKVCPQGPARRALEIRQEASKASTAKLRAMIQGAGADGRCRGLFEYHGAGTGRWAGRRVQTQNMPRTPKSFKPSDAEEVFEWLKHPGGVDVVKGLYGSTLDAVSWSLRPLLIAAPGKRFVSADFSNIEGRGLAWLAGEDWKLNAFRAFDTITGTDAKGEPVRAGPDNYRLSYAKSFGVPVDTVDDDQRQIGKVQELALGYQGGHGAFLSMAKNYGIDLEEIAEAIRVAVPPSVWQDAVELYWRGATEATEEILAGFRVAERVDAWNEVEEDDASLFEAIRAEVAKGNRYGLGPDVWAAVRIIVDGWRYAHAGVVMFWRALEDAAIGAVQRPGQITSAGPIRYLVSGDYLLCRLPSGRPLVYPYPRVIETENKYSNRPTRKLEYEGVDSRTRKWQIQKAYGGLLAENVTQAISRDVLAEAMIRLEARGYETVMHVHDEILSEVPSGFGSLKEFADIMGHEPKWADGWPIAVAGWEGARYRK